MEDLSELNKEYLNRTNYSIDVDCSIYCIDDYWEMDVEEPLPYNQEYFD